MVVVNALETEVLTVVVLGLVVDNGFEEAEDNVEVPDEDNTEEDEENDDASDVSDENFGDEAVKLGDTEYVDGEVG